MLFDGSSTAGRTLVLAHGAGAPMDSPFMNAMAEGLAGPELQVVRFEFPYMQRRRETGKKSGPNTAKILLSHYREVIASLGDPENMVIGGKSMGGRIASMVAEQSGVAGLVCLGYPFHPPGRPEKLRTAHLEDLRVPTLIMQGERDPFGTTDDVRQYALSDSIQVQWLPDGDHSFKPRKKSGHTEAQNWQRAVEQIRAFLSTLG